MKTIRGKIFTAKITVERVQEDGLAKNVKEEYAVRAVSFTDCEAKLTKELASAENVKKNFDVLAEAVAPYNEVYVFDEGEKFYKIKTEESYMDDHGKEKKNSYYYLLNANSIEQARKNIIEAYADTQDWNIAAIVEQKILSVIE